MNERPRIPIAYHPMFYVQAIAALELRPKLQCPLVFSEPWIARKCWSTNLIPLTFPRIPGPLRDVDRSPRGNTMKLVVEKHETFKITIARLCSSPLRDTSFRHATSATLPTQISSVPSASKPSIPTAAGSPSRNEGAA